MNPLKRILKQREQASIKGVYSACTANFTVIEAVLRKGKETMTPIVIEATANQVDQYGGYTGMKPSDFADKVKELCEHLDVDFNQIILGGDHLGPLTFTKYHEEKAMKEASELVKQYVLAGFTKIHIDTSMKVASDDVAVPLNPYVMAKRAKILMDVAEEAYQQRLKQYSDAIAPCYMIGSEVPIPGGEQEVVDTLAVTKPEDFIETVAIFSEILGEKHMDNVVAIVVQPGVEFGDNQVFYYNPQAAKSLIEAKHLYPNLVFEGHSTDYQKKEDLRAMVDDHIAILKVGPALTFAYRQALYALDQIEKEIGVTKPSFLREVINQAMMQEPKYWHKYYQGTANELEVKKNFSYSDRIRYYLPFPTVEKAIELLKENINHSTIPLPLIKQWLPKQYDQLVNGRIQCTFDDLVMDVIGEFIDDYLYAIKR